MQDKYGRSSAVFKDKLNTTDQREGLWGSHLPIVTMFHSYLGGSQCGECSVPPSPCPSHLGHTYCSTNPAPMQCEQPPCHLGNNSGSGWIEWTAVPVADMEGSQQQDVFFRFTKVDSNGTVVAARYFDTVRAPLPCKRCLALARAPAPAPYPTQAGSVTPRRELSESLRV